MVDTPIIVGGVAGLGIIVLMIIRRLLRGPENPLRFDELEKIFTDSDPMQEINREPSQRIAGAAISIQILSSSASIMYHQSFGDEHQHVTETLDICVPCRPSMILSFVDGRLTVFTRIGGATFQGDSLNRWTTPDDRAAARRLLDRVRTIMILD